MPFTSFPVTVESRATEHIQERIRSLLLFNDVRLMELLESVQYGLGYLSLGFLAGVSLDFNFPKFDENKEAWPVFWEVVAQCICLILVIFYVRKIVKIMPFLFVLGSSKYRPYEADEYSGEIMIAVVLIGSQINMIKKIDLVSRRLYRYLYNTDKSIGTSLGI